MSNHLKKALKLDEKPKRKTSDHLVSHETFLRDSVSALGLYEQRLEGPMITQLGMKEFVSCILSIRVYKRCPGVALDARGDRK